MSFRVKQSFFLFLVKLAFFKSHRADAFANDLDFSVAASMHLKSVSVAFRPLGFSLMPKLNMSLGLRNTFFFSRIASFMTAEPKDLRDGRKETVRSTEFFLSATNALVQVNYQLLDSMFLGFNIDLFGVSFGNSTKLSDEVSSSSANPSQFNLLIFDNYDRGSLNSQFLVVYNLDSSYRISFGLAHQFVEYQSSNKFAFDNRRFRLKDNSFVLVVSKNFEQ